MKKFFSFIIRQSVAVILIVILVLGLGVWSTMSMSINLLPDINVPMVCVQVIYPGANAASVEEDVTAPIEEGLSALSGVTEMESYSYDNLSAIVVSFEYGTDTTDKKSEISSKISLLDLPDGISTTVYDFDLNAEALAVLSLTSDAGLDDAYEKARALSLKIAAIDGVESVELKGGAEYSYAIKPFGGLELIAPLIVQAFSYGALDIPLGNITVSGGDGHTDVQIRNNSDVKEEADIDNMPLSLPSSVVALLSSVKQVMRYYDDSTADDLRTLQSDLGEGVITVLRELDGMSSDDVSKLSSLKTYMNIGSSYTAEQLKSFKRSRYYNEIYNRVTVEDENGERQPKSDEELEELVTEISEQYSALSQYITVDMLKVVRDGKLDIIIAFREQYLENTANNPDYDPDLFYELTDADYFILETGYAQVYAENYDYYPAAQLKGYGTADAEEGYDYINFGNLTEKEEEEIRSYIDFARKTSATGLANIADKKREAEENGDSVYNPTNAECALLFTGTDLSSEHPIVMSETFMAFVRSENYEENMNVLIEKRAEYAATNAETGAEELTAEQFFDAYSSMNLEGVFEYTLSVELIDFILKADLNAVAADGSYVVKVSEVATIERTASYSSYAYYYDGQMRPTSGIIIEVYKSNGANSSSVVDMVISTYEEIASEEGYGAKVTLLDDQSEFISDSIANVLVSMVIGGVLAIIVIFMFLKKVRLSLVIAITMPLSVLAALICLYLMGITLNMVSLGGLAVGIGMLVDNSIVVIESISKHRDRGKNAFDAAVDGTVEVGGALFGSTLTTVCVFIPIIFTGGLTAEIFTDLAYAVIFSLAFSLIVAVTVIPALYALFEGGTRMLKGGNLSPAPAAVGGASVATEGSVHINKAETSSDIAESAKEEAGGAKPEKGKKRGLSVLKEPVIMNKLTQFYSGILPKVLSHKLVTVIIALVVFGSSIGLLFLTGTEFLPSIDKGQIEVNMTYGSGKELTVVQETCSRSLRS